MLVPVRVSVICGQNLPVDGVVKMPKPQKAHSFVGHPRSSIWKRMAALYVCKSSLRWSFLYSSGEPMLPPLLGFSFHPPGSHFSGKVQKTLPTCACLPFRLLFVRKDESLLICQAQPTTGQWFTSRGVTHYWREGGSVVRGDLLRGGWLTSREVTHW